MFVIFAATSFDGMKWMGKLVVNEYLLLWTIVLPSAEPKCQRRAPKKC
jgi:hypothetical protein